MGSLRPEPWRAMPESPHTAPDAALDGVVRDHGAVLERVVWGYVDNAPDRDDLMQEILTALWRALPRFRGDSSERTFVLRVAHNRGITFSIRRRRFQGLPEDGQLPDPAPLAEQRLIEEQRRDRRFQGIRRLPAGRAAHRGRRRGGRHSRYGGRAAARGESARGRPGTRGRRRHRRAVAAAHPPAREGTRGRGRKQSKAFGGTHARAAPANS